VSLTSPVPDPDTGIAFTAAGQPCFYCGHTLSDPAIHWMGHSTEIYVHPDCLFPLFVRLCRDRHELDAPDYYRRLREGRGR
jgi:hypothetical protein